MQPSFDHFPSQDGEDEVEDLSTINWLNMRFARNSKITMIPNELEEEFPAS